MKLTNKAKKGFTLVELVVVIAVIAILAAVSVGAYFGITESAKEAQLKQEAEQVHLAMRIISLKGDENQTLKREGLVIAENGLETFEDQLSYELGWDGLEVTLTEPTEVTDKLVYLYTSSTGASNQNGDETLYVYFNYYTRAALGKKAKVNIIGGDDIGVTSSNVVLAKHPCGIHTIDVSGDHETKYECGHYACQHDESKVIAASCGTSGHYECDGLDHSPAPCDEGHYKCDGKNHERNTNDTCLSGHTYQCQCHNYTVPENSIEGVDDSKAVLTYEDDSWNFTVAGETLKSGESFGCCTKATKNFRVELYLDHYIYTTDFYLYGGIGSWSVKVNPQYKNKTSFADMKDEIFGTVVEDLSYCYSECVNLQEIPRISTNTYTLYYAFYNCKSLTSAKDLSWPKKIYRIQGIFSGCENLIYGPSEIPGRVEYLSHAFENCLALKKAPILNEGLKEIDRAFHGCKMLEGEIKIPTTVYTIAGAFWNCKNLEKIVSENDFKNIRDFEYAIYGCDKIKDFYLPEETNVSEVNCNYLYNGKKDYIPNDTYTLPNYVKYANGLFEEYKSSNNFSLTINYDSKTNCGISMILSDSTIEGTLTINLNGYPDNYNFSENGCSSMLWGVKAEKVIISGNSSLSVKALFVDTFHRNEGIYEQQYNFIIENDTENGTESLTYEDLGEKYPSIQGLIE